MDKQSLSNRRRDDVICYLHVAPSAAENAHQQSCSGRDTSASYQYVDDSIMNRIETVLHQHNGTLQRRFIKTANTIKDSLSDGTKL